MVVDNTQRGCRFWDVVTGKSIGAPPRHQGTVDAVAFSSDGSRVLTGSRDGIARIWESPSPRVQEKNLPTIVLWIQSITGLEHDQEGTIDVLDRENWWHRREQVQALGGPPIYAIR